MLKRTMTSTCLLTGLPASLLPTDLRAFVAKRISHPAGLLRVVQVPEQTWAVQTNILMFSSREPIDELRRSLAAGHGTHGPGVAVVELAKAALGRAYLAAVERQASLRTRILAQHGLAPPPAPEPYMPGKAVLLAGLPAASCPLQIENTLRNTGLPLLPARAMPPLDRLSRALYWPLLDPPPPCRAAMDSNKTTRAQVLYAPSAATANHLVAELNHLVPSWLGSRAAAGWKLKAKVLY